MTGNPFGLPDAQLNICNVQKELMTKYAIEQSLKMFRFSHILPRKCLQCFLLREYSKVTLLVYHVYCGKIFYSSHLLC